MFCSTLKILMAENFQALSSILGEMNASNDEHFAAGTPQIEIIHQLNTCTASYIDGIATYRSYPFIPYSQSALSNNLRKDSRVNIPSKCKYSRLWLGIVLPFPLELLDVNQCGCKALGKFT